MLGGRLNATTSRDISVMILTSSPEHGDGYDQKKAEGTDANAIMEHERPAGDAAQEGFTTPIADDPPSGATARSHEWFSRPRTARSRPVSLVESASRSTDGTTVDADADRRRRAQRAGRAGTREANHIGQAAGRITVAARHLTSPSRRSLCCMPTRSCMTRRRPCSSTRWSTACTACRSS